MSEIPGELRFLSSHEWARIEDDGTVTVEVVDGTSGQAEVAHELSVPNGTTVEIAGTSKLVLESGDKVQAKADASSTIELFVSWLHIT